MHKAFFGLITVAALVAVGILISSRSTESAVRNLKVDRSPIANVATPSCCSEMPSRGAAVVNGRSTEFDVNTACMRRTFVADTAAEECSADATGTSAKCPGCCSGKEGECCASETAEASVKGDSCCASEKGECCSEETSTSAKSDSCCSDDEDEEATSEDSTISTSLPSESKGKCPCCQKETEAEANPK